PAGPRARRPAPACDAEPLLAVLAQLVDALEFLHGQGVVHRDLKPSNILVDVDGRVRLLDFGLVSRIDRAEAISQDGVIVGTLAYLSPEQLHGEAATAAADLYALGCVLYQLLTGELPFRDGLAAAMAGRLASPPRVDAVVDGVAPALADIVHRLMAVDPRERPGLDEIRSALGLPAGSSAHRTDRLPLTASGDRFVGRAAELAALAGCLEAARHGRTQLALVSGPSGIGKTALADEVLRRATALGFVCFRGRSYEREQLPFVAFDRVVDTITVALQRWPRERIAPLRPVLRSLARIFPALGLVTDEPHGREEPLSDDDLDPRVQRRHAFDAFARLLAHWQAEGPLLLVLDDLQWADDESLAMLEALLTGGTGRLAILALARLDSASRSHPLETMVNRLDTGAIGQVVTIALDPMPVDEAVEIVDSVGGGRLDADTARALADHAAGNPFLVRRLAEHLAGLDAAERAAVLDAAGSSDDVLRAMIRALSPNAEQVLALAAAAGGDVPASLLRDVSGLPGADFDLAAGELMAGRFLKTVPAAPIVSGRARGAADDAPRVDLYHDRIREVVYRGLDDERRRALHRSLAVTLQASASDDGHDAEALARHWGEAGDREQRRKFALEAAELAASKLAFRRAAELLRVVQADADPGEPATDAAARWERIGEQFEYAGDLPAAADAYQTALKIWLERTEGAAPAAERSLAILRLRARAGAIVTATGDFATARRIFADGLASLGLPLDRSLLGRMATMLGLSLRDRLAGSKVREVVTPDPAVTTRARFFEEVMLAFQILWPLPAGEAALRLGLLGRRAADHGARVHALSFAAASPV
ncbi:MAG TPA: AAA family ATPase, partial [Kofleriaceae bacterium]|nr:AAA family ATPase [Kofleriaceae bacterium]